MLPSAWRRQRDGRQFLETHAGLPAGGDAVDFLFRNEDEHFVAARAQNFRDRQSGKKVSTGSAACDHDIHGQVVS